MIAWFARNHVAANLLMLTIIATGLYSLLYKLPLEFFPSFESDTINVSVTLRGASPEDVELGISTRIEEAIKDIEGIEEYSSRSSEGSSSIRIEVQSGYEPREILDEVKSRVDAINTLPSDAERPIISLAQYMREVISVTVAGPVSEREIRELGEQIRDEILQLSEVTQVDLTGVRDYEVSVEVDQDRLREFSLKLQDIASAINNSSLDLSAGNILSDGGEISIRSKGQAYYQNDFENLVLKTSKDGTLLRLKDVATVKDAFEEKAMRTRFNGQIAATIDVYSTSSQSAIRVADQVKDYVQSRRETLPQGIEINYWSDRSEVIKKRIKTLTSNAIQGGILVIILLSLFLRPSVAFWVFLGIPISFTGAFFAMHLMGVSINMISLFAFIVVLGIVVDDAIVTGENVYTHLRNGSTGLKAAIDGTKEVSVPVTFGVLTTIVAFVPLAFMGGHRGPIFAQIPMIVVPVLIFSLIESKLILPAHLKHISMQSGKTQNKLQRWQASFADGFEAAILRYYQPLLKRCLGNKRIPVIIFSGLLVCILATFIFGHFRFVFFPRIPSETVRLNLTMPIGTPFDVTDTHMQRVLLVARDLQQKYTDEKSGESIISNILVSTGGRGGASHVGQARFELTSPEARSIKVTSVAIAREWRTQIGDIPGAEEVSFRAEIGRASDPIDIQLRASNLAVLTELSARVKEHLSSYQGVFDINDSLASGKQELNIDLTPEAYLLGVNRADIVNQVRQAFFGLQAQRIQRGRDDVRVMIRFPEDERNSVIQLNNMLINTPTGQQIPLGQLASFTPNVSPTSIYRINGYRTINVIADIEKETVNMTALGDDLKVFMDKLMIQYPGVNYKFGGEQEEQSESFTSLWIGFAAILFVIYCLLAIPFASYTQPLIVMSVIPFGAIGAAFGHWLMAMDLTMMSLLGLLALVGVLVNDSLVLVDYINKTRAKGQDLMEAVLNAGVARFRPVMLTSLTTFIGLMPLLFEQETQAQFLIPMAISLGFGIIFATFVTLIMVPVNYVIFEQISNHKPNRNLT